MEGSVAAASAEGVRFGVSLTVAGKHSGEFCGPQIDGRTQKTKYLCNKKGQFQVEYLTMYNTPFVYSFQITKK